MTLKLNSNESVYDQILTLAEAHRRIDLKYDEGVSGQRYQAMATFIDSLMTDHMNKKNINDLKENIKDGWDIIEDLREEAGDFGDFDEDSDSDSDSDSDEE